MKIIKINSSNEPYNGTNKQGKPYTIYQANCVIEMNGKQGTIDVKTMSKKQWEKFSPGAEFADSLCQQQEFKGNKSIMVKAEKIFYQGRGGYQGKEKYTLEEFEAVMDKAFHYSISTLNNTAYNGEKECLNAIFQSYVKYAFEHDVKIPDVKEKVKEVFPEATEDTGVPPEPPADDPFFTE